MANPTKTVPISILHTELSPMLPIIQFKKTSQFINMPQKYSNLTQIPLLCKQCGTEKTYNIYNSMMEQYKSNQFEQFAEKKNNQ